MPMRHISETLPPHIQDKIAAAQAGSQVIKTELIAAGVRAYGWSPDAECANCGDTGRIPNSIRTCGCAAGKAEDVRARSERARLEWESRWRATGVPRRLAGYRLETAPDQDAVATVGAWLDGHPLETGQNLIISGSVGTGKTGFAIGALWRLHELGAGTLQFAGCPAFLDSLRPGAPEEAQAVMASCQKADVLVFDDLGTTRGTDWEQERLYVLLNERYERQRPTIVTTNISIAELGANLGARTVSRLFEDPALLVLDGPDRRRTGWAS